MYKNIYKSFQMKEENFFHIYVKLLCSDYCGVSTLQQNGVAYTKNQSEAD